jgi:tRNA pseudouridine38-40 synthase
MLTVAYEGTKFHGWQKQAGAAGPDAPALRTVQGVLEAAVRAVVCEPANLLGASRTDAGVHALGQVAAFSCAAEIQPPRLARALNGRLPDDLRVRRARTVPEGFSPISDAIAKAYRYRIASGLDGRRLPPLFDRATTTWIPYRLDPQRMNEAARRLIGAHDFASFTRTHHGRESTVRTVHECLVRVGRRGRLILDVCGDGFLHNMVRILAGTLVEVGRGRVEPQAMTDILAARDRCAAGPTLPPQGLFLMWVRFEEAALRMPARPAAPEAG